MKIRVLPCILVVFLGVHAHAEELTKSEAEVRKGLDKNENDYIDFVLSRSSDDPLKISNIENWKTGDAGDISLGYSRIQIVGESSMIVTTLYRVSSGGRRIIPAAEAHNYIQSQLLSGTEPVYRSGETIWIDGIKTKDFTDGEREVSLPTDVSFVVLPSITYPTVSGSSKTVKRVTAVSQSKLKPIIESILQERGYRTWRDKDGNTIRASYVVGGAIVKLKLMNGEIMSVKKKNLSKIDQDWVLQEIKNRRSN